MTAATNPTHTQKPPLRAPKSAAAILRFAVCAVVALAGDLWLKAWAFANVAGVPIDGDMLREHAELVIPPHDATPVIPKLLSLQLTVNHGAVFGLGHGGRWVFVAIAVAACAVIAFVFFTSMAKQWKTHLALGLILGGAIGNLYDRFHYGVVRDMLLLLPETNLPFGWSWSGGNTLVYPWIFNLADAALCVGIAAIVIGIIFGKPQPAKRDPATTK